MKGQQPKPVEQHILQGTFRADLHAPASVPDRGIPDPPGKLTGKVKAAWAYLVPVLDGLGLLSRSHGIALFLLARAWADYFALCGKVAPGNDVKTKKGSNYWNLYAAARDKAEKRLRVSLLAFGLTLESFQRLNVRPPAADDDDAPPSVSGFARKRGV